MASHGHRLGCQEHSRGGAAAHFAHRPPPCRSDTQSRQIQPRASRTSRVSHPRPPSCSSSVPNRGSRSSRGGGDSRPGRRGTNRVYRSFLTAAASPRSMVRRSTTRDQTHGSSRTASRGGLRPSTPNRPASISSYHRAASFHRQGSTSSRISGVTSSTDNLYRLPARLCHGGDGGSHMRSFDLTQRLERHSEEPADEEVQHALATSGTRLSSVRFPSTSLDGGSQAGARSRSGTAVLAATSGPVAPAAVAADGGHPFGQMPEAEWFQQQPAAGSAEATPVYEGSSHVGPALHAGGQNMSVGSQGLGSSNARDSISQEGSQALRGSTRSLVAGSPAHVRTVRHAPHGTGVVTMFRAPHRQGSTPQHGLLSPGPLHIRHHSRGSSRGAGPLGEGRLADTPPPLQVSAHSSGSISSTRSSGRDREGVARGARSGSRSLMHNCDGSIGHGSRASSTSTSANDMPRVVTAPDAASAPRALPTCNFVQAYREPLETLLEGSHEPLSSSAAAAAAGAVAAASAADNSSHSRANSVFELTSFGFSSASLSPSAAGNSPDEFTFNQPAAEPWWQQRQPQRVLRPPTASQLASLARANTIAHRSTPRNHDSGAGIWDSLPSISAGSPQGAVDDPSTSLAYLSRLRSGSGSGDYWEAGATGSEGSGNAASVLLGKRAQATAAHQQRGLPHVPKLDTADLQVSAGLRPASARDDSSNMASRVSSIDAQLPMPPLGVKWLTSSSQLPSSASTSPTKTPGRIAQMLGGHRSDGPSPRPRGAGAVSPHGDAAAAAVAALLRTSPRGPLSSMDRLSSSEGMAALQTTTTTNDESSDRSPIDAGSIVLPPPPLHLPSVRRRVP